LPDEHERRRRDLLNAAKEFYLHYEQVYRDSQIAASVAVQAAETLLSEIELRERRPVTLCRTSADKPHNR
jgi:hypothetical protein